LVGDQIAAGDNIVSYLSEKSLFLKYVFLEKSSSQFYSIRWSLIWSRYIAVSLS